MLGNVNNRKGTVTIGIHVGPLGKEINSHFPLTFTLDKVSEILSIKISSLKASGKLEYIITGTPEQISQILELSGVSKTKK